MRKNERLLTSQTKKKMKLKNFFINDFWID